MRKAKQLLFIIFSAVTLVYIGCARIVKPPGGEKDITAPMVLESSPEHKSVNFDGNKIIVEFNEFIKIDDLENQLVVSPLVDPKPDVYMRGKKLIVKLNADLADNTTYNFNFGESLKDITEGNPLSNFQYTIATGAVLDSMSISGRAKDAFTGEGSEDMWVLLYKSAGDSTFRKRKPDYIAKTKEDGRFEFNALPGGSFEIYALDDQNSNLIYDLPNEKIAFTNSVINIDSSNIYDIVLNTFIESEDKAILTEIKQTGYSSFVLNYSKYIEQSTIDFIENIDFLAENDLPGEKETIWFSSVPDSSVNLIIQGEEILLDTSRIIFSNKFNEKPDTLFTIKQSSKKRGGGSKQQSSDPITLFFNNPIKELGKSRLYEKGKEVTITDSDIGENPRSIVLTADLEENKLYKLYFETSPIDIYNNEMLNMDSISIVTMKEEDYSTFILETENYDSSANYIAGFYSELNSNSLIREIQLNPDTSTIVNRILPGKYYFIVFDDENKNSAWDKGSYDLNKTPEKTWSLGKQLNFKGNFDVEAGIDLK